MDNFKVASIERDTYYFSKAFSGIARLAPLPSFPQIDHSIVTETFVIYITPNHCEFFGIRMSIFVTFLPDLFDQLSPGDDIEGLASHNETVIYVLQTFSYPICGNHPSCKSASMHSSPILAATAGPRRWFCCITEKCYSYILAFYKKHTCICRYNFYKISIRIYDVYVA